MSIIFPNGNVAAVQLDQEETDVNAYTRGYGWTPLRHTTAKVSKSCRRHLFPPLSVVTLVWLWNDPTGEGRGPPFGKMQITCLSL
mmetsp:Transcript_21963/g.33514  ORF Transcript_21963/g.33514 Transcript_21963/m.33514 type:complete len:85 (-) Transcript_21963:132-386(-)